MARKRTSGNFLVMKWVYPLIIFLALVLGNIFFTTNLKAAEPSSSKSQCIAFFKTFYKNQDKSFIKLRLANNDSLHSFYRSFPPVYFSIMKDDKILKRFKRMENFEGIIAGDLHAENFGFVIGADGKPFLAVNDIDEVTKGRLDLDIFRHFLSSKILQPGIKWDDYLNAYTMGLREKNRPVSPWVKGKLDEARDTAKGNFDEHVKIKKGGKIKFRKRKEPSRDTTEKENESLKKILKNKFPDIKIHDSYVRLKDSGGSAGLSRFEVLAKIGKEGTPKWLDIKEWDVASFDKVFNDGKNSLTTKERLAQVKEVIYNQKMKGTIDIVEIEGKIYSMRFVDQFSANITLDQEDILNTEKTMQLLLDEAYVAGQRHGKSLQEQGKKVLEYIDAWKDTVENENIDNLAKNIISKLDKLYDDSK